jgi:hypothetical protein
MHDPVGIRRRIDRVVARVDRRDDFGQLLASGAVDEVDDVEAWRAEISARHARTGSRFAPGSARHRVDEIRACGMRLTTTKDLFNVLTGGAGNADHCARL